VLIRRGLGVGAETIDVHNVSETNTYIAAPPEYCSRRVKDESRVTS